MARQVPCRSTISFSKKLRVFKIISIRHFLIAPPSQLYYQLLLGCLCSQLWNTVRKWCCIHSLCLRGLCALGNFRICQHKYYFFLSYLCCFCFQIPEDYWLRSSILSPHRSDTGKFRSSLASLPFLLVIYCIAWFYDTVKGIAVRRSDLVGLIMRRNELASDILKASTSQQLPPMLQVWLLIALGRDNSSPGCDLINPYFPV